ncbi:HSF-type DNA-binding-domain-containing protein [Flagelloscypha sp. PMI_526]|nr:HSF-type DNA-binding-domain-containing protein [Flagelloscypha sp. PMI_526]
MADIYASSRNFYQPHQYPAPIHHPPPPHSDESDEHPEPHQKHDTPPPKPETKPQATFLTKLYALLERPENHHMIRWDPAGEHIIVERPEQLALHVLPSIYRQSRFASFSRQLNIYGFMRKVNLRNVDPAIDDPDASTWSHPTLNRHSPPEVVANFKRRVPPRLPKPRKRDTSESQAIPPPRSATGISPPPPLNIPNPSNGGPGNPGGKLTPVGRARGFSAPNPYNGATAPNTAGPPPPTWNGNYQHQHQRQIPPLTVPSNPPHMSHSSMYGHSSHSLQPISPAEESPSYHHMPSYGNEGYSYTNGNGSSEPPHWNSYNANGASHNNSGSLSSLLNPSGHSNGAPPNGYSGRPTPTINTSYGGQFAHMPVEQSANSPISPDGHSRPNTGYSMHSMAHRDDPYMSPVAPGYDSRPGSSHHRGHSPGGNRPPSSSSHYPPSSSLPIRRPRRHSQAAHPYASPYPEADRPETPQDADQQPPGSAQGYSPELTATGSISRVRSMIQLPSVDPYGLGNQQSQPQFAFNAGMDMVPPSSAEASAGGAAPADWRAPSSATGARPSTGASTISAASSGSQANTPPIQEGVDSAKIHRC